MYIILGATGHVGSAVAQSLLDQSEEVTVITHDTKKKEEWQQKGVTVAIADVHEANQLRTVFKRGKRLFVLNPPLSRPTRPRKNAKVSNRFWRL